MPPKVRPVAESSTIAVPIGRFSCVVDEPPRFHLDALRWFACLTERAGVEPSDLRVYVVGPDSSDVLDYLRSRGVTVGGVDRFDARSPHCNKISGALRMAEEDVVGTAVLCDTDLAILEDPRELAVPAGAVAGKLVDAPVPPLDRLEAVFSVAGLDPPSKVALPWSHDEWTVAGNYNGGLYLVPGPLLTRVASAWALWAHWLLDRVELLAEWSVYVDQVAMALALAAEGIGSEQLGVRWNTPIHDPTRLSSTAPEPSIIHYHQKIDPSGRIEPTGVASIDQRILDANAAIDEVWADASPEDTHRALAFRAKAEAASNRTHEALRLVLGKLHRALDPASTLEVGGGEIGSITSGLLLRGYVGIDTSADAVQRARALRPGSEFIVGSLTDHPRVADLVLSLDLSDRQPERSRETVKLLWEATGRCLVVRWEEGSEGSSEQYRSNTVQDVVGDAEVYPLEREGLPSTFIVVRPPGHQHPRDFRTSTLSPLLPRHPHTMSLLTLRLEAQRTTGFYPDHAPRLWEYPVVAEILEAALRPGSRLVDVGAGVTPLAPYLASRGYVVDTVDPVSTQPPVAAPG